MGSRSAGHKTSLTAKTVVVIGAGFAGMAALKELLKHQENLKIILINDLSHFLFIPSLWDFSSYGNPEDEFGIGLAEYSQNHHIEYIQDSVLKIDANKKSIECSKQHLAYDYLLLAPGAKPNFFGIEGMEQFSLHLKSSADAKKIKTALAELVSKSSDMLGSEYKLSIAIGGGGLTGVETAIGVALFLESIMRKQLTETPFEITIVEGSPDILPGMPKKAVELTKKYISSHNISLQPGRKISKVENKEKLEISFSEGNRINADLLIWTGGVKPSECYRESGLAIDERGCIHVNDYLQADGFEDVFSAGDCTLFFASNKKPVPMTAHWAMVEGKIAAKNLIRHHHRQKMAVFRAKIPSPMLIGLGRKDAVYVGKHFIFAGWPFAILKKLVEKYTLWSLK